MTVTERAASPLMSAADHYRQAEHLLASSVSEGGTSLGARHIARAQVHATLALAGATALAAFTHPDHPTSDRADWLAAVSTGTVR